MRPDRDIETVLDAWFAPGPTTMPDRVLDGALDRVDRQPQRRLAPPSRDRTMFSTLKLPVAAGLAAVILGLAIAQGWRAGPSDVLQAPGVTPATSVSPSASATTGASPSASAGTAAPSFGPVPNELRHLWMGPPKVVASLVTNATIGVWGIEVDRLTIGYGGTFLESTVRSAGPDTLVITSPGSGQSPCAPGAEGTWRWRLSAGGTRLRLEAIDEACAPRAAFLEGEWSKGSCEIVGHACMGALEAGTYVAGAFDPRGGPGDPPLARFGAFGFAVPDGWANDEENISSYELTTEAGFERLVSGSDQGADFLMILAQPVALAPYADDDCVPTMDPSVERTVSDFAGWLTSHPNLVASDPEPMEIDGHPGVVIDVDLDPATLIASPCFDDAPGVPLFANGAGFDPKGVWFEDLVYGDHWVATMGAASTDPIRLVLLDLDGDPLVIAIDTADPAVQAAFVEQAMPIVESFTFPVPS